MFFIIVFLLIIIFFINKYRNIRIKNNKKITNFKNNFLSKENKIKKIFLRNDERLANNPDININIDIYEKEEEIKQKSIIHRSRLSRFNKSKLNGEYIYKDEENNLYKLINGKKITV